MNLSEDLTKWSRSPMSSLADNYNEMFFLEKLSVNNCWTTLLSEQFKEHLIKDLIDKLAFFYKEIEEHKLKKIPAILVMGEDNSSGTSIFATRILGEYITNNHSSRTYNISLRDLMIHKDKWQNVIDDFNNNKLVTIEISKTEYVDVYYDIINKIAEIIKYDTYKETSFIIYGKAIDIYIMMEKIPIMQELFNEKNTFCISSNRNLIDLYDFNDEENIEHLFIHDIIESTIVK